jgi:hypothetical protein
MPRCVVPNACCCVHGLRSHAITRAGLNTRRRKSEPSSRAIEPKGNATRWPARAKVIGMCSILSLSTYIEVQRRDTEEIPAVPNRAVRARACARACACARARIVCTFLCACIMRNTLSVSTGPSPCTETAYMNALRPISLEERHDIS